MKGFFFLRPVLAKLGEVSLLYVWQQGANECRDSQTSLGFEQGECLAKQIIERLDFTR